MADPIDLKSLVKGVEDGIEAKFGSHPGFKQVKAVLQKKGGRPDPRAMIMDSRAVFTGDNKPLALATRGVDNLEKQVATQKDKLLAAVAENRRAVADNIEKNKALLENRKADIAHDVKDDEALFTGRLAAENGTQPLAGARVIVRTSGTDPKIVAQAVTDANGEYVIKMGAAEIEKATRTLAIAYETRDGTLIDEKKKVYLSAARGKTKVVDGDVAEDKKDLAAELIRSSDERKQQALLEMAELKKSAAELNQVSFKTRSSADKLSQNLAGLKGLLGIRY
ncbi:hypothetical protein D1AOALGA4SA_8254 [Olavius algarvensis Delta 1 endosymbiont]|nr:hypothetical protein D1AOALGA4SA_8254 [Olavius algarvensis Delta 1 endosymbiont]